MKPPAPGVYPDIPFSTYLSIEAVSNSYLTRMAITPAHAQTPFTSTAATLFGQAAHALTLEGEDVFNNTVIESSAATINAKATQGLILANPDKIIVMKGDIDRAKRCRDSIMAHPTASRIMELSSHREVSIFWVDKTTGINCKARIDLLAPPQDGLSCGILSDLKFLRDGGASERKFFYELKDKYAQQAAFYCTGATEVCIDNYNVFSFIVCETTAPYRVEVHDVQDDWVWSWGTGEIARLMRLELECRAGGVYPAFANAGAIVHDLPEWLK